MKRFFIPLLLITFNSSHQLFSMDQPHTPSQEMIIQKIQSDISMRYGSSPAHNDLLYGLANIITPFILNSRNCLDIIQIVERHCASNTAIDMPDTLSKLYNQDNFFKSAIDYFVTCASDNLKLLTANNIQTIEDPKQPQPIAELNKLSLPLKTYVMNRALKDINYTYDIVLSGQHHDDIQAFDICELTDQAVTSSFKEPTPHNWNNTFLLWDLKTGKAIKKFDESNPINLLAFNPDGSCIAAAMYNENIVKIWCPKTGYLLHNLSSYRIDALTYSHPKPSIITAIHEKNSCPYAITQWKLSSDDKVGELLNCSYVRGRSKYSYFDGSKYKAFSPLTCLTGKNNELTVTKKCCIPLYICMKAIERTNTVFSRIKIESSSSFHQLAGDIEQKKVHAAIQAKSNTAQKDNKLELISLDK